jgi:leucyl-tRNA synthetase
MLKAFCMRYDPKSIEPKWQGRWESERAFKTPSTPQELAAKPKFYVLDMFPYPSGAGLHVGHPEGYTATDIVARYKRMAGFNVLHPMGWDAFGLPAERAAMRENIHPAIITQRNVDNFRKQIERLGFSYDWEREINTSSVDYYRFTQELFLKLYEKDLAYLAEVPVNWCPALGTVLANEEVKDGKYVETGDPVERRMMRQWMLKITQYAERLIDDLETVDWPDSVKDMQRNWIGKSVGAEIVFKIADHDLSFEIFTTCPDTLFGATYCVLAPEHPLVRQITSNTQRNEVQAYVEAAKNKNDMLRTDLAKDKTGAFTGAFAINPVNGKRLPIWIADYVLMTYGTGAIMAVPAHDERDHMFAKTFGLPIVQVVEAPFDIQERAFTGDGVHMHSEFLNGLDTAAAKNRMVEWLEKNGSGRGKVQYRLRDWLFSRQRYWGEPFPIAYADDGEVVALTADELPVELPRVDAYKPTEDGRPPLARADASWLQVRLKDGRMATRETNTMPQWAGSCWYYLRFLDAQNRREPWSLEAEQYWMPVDLYIGGVEHAVLHLLYARFWHKVFYDCGMVHTQEPFQKLFNQGMILAHSYKDKAGKYYTYDAVEERDGASFAKATGERLEVQIEKMSKSKYNVFNPDDVIDAYGADAMRLYEMFMGPLETVKPWQMSGVEGVSRFLQRVWRLVVNEISGENDARLKHVAPSEDVELWRLLHKTIKKVKEDTENLRFNTAISQMMTFVNEATARKALSIDSVKIFLRVLSPYAPHLAEELWERLGETSLICKSTWPVHDEALCQDDVMTIVLQHNGKRRAEIQVARDITQTDLEALALADPSIAKFLEGRAPKKVIVVPGRLVNVVG